MNPNSKQAELLASVASDLNTFRNDGSFMDRFAASKAGGVAGGHAGEEEAEEVHLPGGGLQCVVLTWSEDSRYTSQVCVCF